MTSLHDPAGTPAARQAGPAADLRNLRIAVLAAIVLMVTGMMLVIGGVLVTGLFLPGVVVIGLGLLAGAAAAVLVARAGGLSAAADGTG
jgi:hypothetical protein